MELSFKEAEFIAMADCPSDCDKNKFKSNAMQVLIACNSWFKLMGDLGLTPGEILLVRRQIISDGLYDVVKTSVDLAEKILASCETVADLRTSIDPRDSRIAYIVASLARRSTCDDVRLLRDILQFLLFLERFTYLYGDPSNSLLKFKRVNENCRLYEYDWTVWPKSTILGMLREEFSCILGTCPPSISISDCGFTNGSTNQTTADYLSKWISISHYYPNYKGCVEYPLIGGFTGVLLQRYPKLTPVPKSMTSYRIIAPENPVVNYWSTAYLAALRKRLVETCALDYINERDQSVNKNLALEGSLNRLVCTIDMSSASDSISKAVFHAILPQAWSAWVESVESYYVTLPDGTRKRLFTLFTSGHPLTWLLEACYFLAIARVAARLAMRPDLLLMCYAYGDDLVVPSEIYLTVCELLESLGHTVNTRKSYVNGFFRESCGIWAYQGIDITPIHWPRRAVKPDKGAIASVLTDIQKKAFGIYPSLQKYCTSEALRLFPKMTSSAPGSGSDDLWDDAVDPLTEELTKHWHYGPVLTDRKRDTFLDHLVYYQYLEYGPLYMSDLDRLLGVSTSRFIVYRTKGESSVTFS